MYNSEPSGDHPVDKLARIERLAREGIDAATADLNRTARQRLYDAEARAVIAYESAFTAGLPLDCAVAGVNLPSDIDSNAQPRVSVVWNPFRAFAYLFQHGNVRCYFDTRDAVLLCISQRMGGVQA